MEDARRFISVYCKGEDPSLGRSLMEDIRRFIMGKDGEKNQNIQVW